EISAATYARTFSELHSRARQGTGPRAAGISASALQPHLLHLVLPWRWRYRSGPVGVRAARFLLVAKRAVRQGPRLSRLGAACTLVHHPAGVALPDSRLRTCLCVCGCRLAIFFCRSKARSTSPCRNHHWRLDCLWPGDG